MIYGKKFLFAHLQKTAGTFCAKVLKDKFPKSTRMKKHETIKNFLKNRSERKYILGSIRDPLELYVSLWAYGCQSRGSLFGRLTRPKLSHNLILAIKLIFSKQFFYLKYWKTKSSKNYNNLYEDVNDISNFQTWLKLINKDESFFDVGLDVPMYLSNDQKIGLMSRRFLKIYCDYKISNGKIVLSSIKTLVNFWIRSENLVGDLSKAINLIKDEGEFYSDSEIVSKKINQSKHNKYNHYYSEDLKKIVYKIDKIIYERS